MPLSTPKSNGGDAEGGDAEKAGALASLKDLAVASLELVHDAILLIEAASGALIEANPAAQRLLEGGSGRPGSGPDPASQADPAVLSALLAQLPPLSQLRQQPMGRATALWTAMDPGRPVELTYRLLALESDSGSLEALLLVLHPPLEPQDSPGAGQLQHLNDLLNEAERQSKIGSWEHVHATDALVCSREARRIWGLPDSGDQPLRFSSLLARLDPDDQTRLLQTYERASQTGDPFQVEYHLQLPHGPRRTLRQQGEIDYAANGEPLNTVGTLQDITEINALQEQLEQAAYTDPLTGLPNKAASLRHLEQLLQGRPYNQCIGLINLDLDSFQSINDSFGPEAGNRLLSAMAMWLRNRLEPDDWIARLGSDEFLVIRGHGTHSPGDAVALAKELQQSLIQTAQLAPQLPMQPSACFGVSTCPEHGIDPHLLLQAANTALMEAKRRGRNQLHAYSTSLSTRIREQLDLEMQLSHAVERQQLRLVYQPQVDGEGRLIGAEALLRWFKTPATCVPPDLFIPLAERSGQIHTIGAWVMEEACRQLRQWDLQGLSLPLLAVNVSAVQLEPQDPPLEASLAAALARHAIPPQRIELEITETALISNPQQARQQLQQLAHRGFRLAIDDFGTGFSSLETLHALALNKLKIDRCFINTLETDLTDQVIVRATLSMARELGLETLAEGVETAQQWQLLKQLGCASFQGYFFDRPLTAEAFAQRLGEPRTSSA
ncbi:bifunctional diguanylate cyclase/phosphodiesterase [Synechococcus sp. CS-1328]|uniref:putative bifunctional diguanylate cyclase/phosphodiesterase n=1 Tax=Synechococcus sp. CS-1328 TaxID=2847976 RepID=UPI00223AE96A|nr:GGDEF and EAL domain-containing protein [Synechococcus sp. CS-1328]MCT0223747.1 EAL domain-containing protein [Synechococcus sp. CS-1328]